MNRHMYVCMYTHTRTHACTHTHTHVRHLTLAHTLPSIHLVKPGRRGGGGGELEGGVYRYVDGREGRGGGGRSREGTDLGQFVLVLLRLASSYVEEDLHNGCLNSLIVVEGKQGTRGITDTCIIIP